MMGVMATDDRLTTEIATLLRRAKQDCGLSFQELMERTGFAQSAIVNWLNGTRSPQIESFYRLCKAMNVSPADILREAEENFERQELLSQALTKAVEQALKTDKRTFVVELGEGRQKVTVEINAQPRAARSARTPRTERPLEGEEAIEAEIEDDGSDDADFTPVSLVTSDGQPVQLRTSGLRPD